MALLKYLTGPYYASSMFFLVILMTLSFYRLIFLALYHSRIRKPSTYFRILIQGVRIDVVLAVYCLSLPVLLTPFLEGYRHTAPFYQVFCTIWFSAWFILIIVMETVTFAHLEAYNIRPNGMVVEYLIYPKQMATMFLNGFFIHLALTAIALVMGVLVVSYFSLSLMREPSTWYFTEKLAALIPISLLLFLGGRSSLGRRPVNPSAIAFTSDPLINDLALNSTYSFLYAVYRMKDESNAARIYGNMAEDKMVYIVRKGTGLSEASFHDPEVPTLHKINPVNKREKPLNLVIIIEESLGAEYVGSLGGLSLTPNLERLSKEGWWFENLYATGTRSVRGIEAVICGFLPTPGRSIVKLEGSQRNFFTLARVLSDIGYSTRFIKGGDCNFDNMKNFFLANGFQEVIDEPHFENPSFKASWGVCDQDVFNKAHDIFSREQDKPFFTVVFTSSNHPPYEFPDNVITPVAHPKQSAYNAVTYADHALGEFFDKAKASSYWDNTVFCVVADHNSHTRGKALVPIDRFHIPGLIIGPGINPRVYSEITSQIDLPPTLLSLMGVSCYSPMVGRNLTCKPDSLPGRAILQFYDNQAYLTGDQVTILRPGKTIEQYMLRNNRLVPAPQDESLTDHALAHALWASWAYKNRAYRYDTPLY